MKNCELFKVSLLISTYNWPSALEKCLMSALLQTRLPDEIIIADDGSKPETLDLINKFKKTTTIPIVHVWHPDQGFRLATIRNKAISKALYDYIVQIDGDIIIEKHFLEDHIRLAQPNAFVCGSRVWLSQEQSLEILQSDSIPRFDYIKFPLKTILNSIRIKLLSQILADRYKKNKPIALRGCNMAFWKSDLISVNGYDQDIQGWGSEDAELAMRLINSGVKKRFIKFSGIAYHLFHSENDKSLLQQNQQVLKDTISNKKKWAINGIISQTVTSSINNFEQV